MNIAVGIGLAFVAMLCWGFGDFLIQRSTRKMGDMETLFIITLFGTLVLLPFVWRTIPSLVYPGNLGSLTILLIAGVILFIAAILDFEALRIGKLSIVEPIWSFEVPVAAMLAFLIIREEISFVQIVLIGTLVICLVLVGLREKHIRRSLLIEKGAVIAILGAVFMGAANFFMGWGGRVTDPLIVNFFTDAFIALLSGVYLLSRDRLGKAFGSVKKNYGLILNMSISDKTAWIAFTFAMTLAPIAVAVALSESYIIVAVILGLMINREKIESHQKIGLFGAIIIALILAVITSA